MGLELEVVSKRFRLVLTLVLVLVVLLMGGLLMGPEGVRGANLLDVRKLLSVAGLLKPRPGILPSGTVSRVLEGPRGLEGREVRLVEGLVAL